MLIRVVDGTPIEKLSLGSHKKVVFRCDSCNEETEQAYRTYNGQTDGKLCRKCRNKHTANREDVKEKQSKYSKEKWSDPEYRRLLVDSGKLSKAIQDAWDRDRGIRRDRMIEDNPMYSSDARLKLSDSESTSEEELKTLVQSFGYTYVERIMRQRGGVQIKVICPHGHETIKRLYSYRTGNTGCSVCSNKFSKAEKDLSDYIKSLGFDVLENNRSVISPLELDIVIPSKNIAIEYCGLYWHGESKGKNSEYHINKLIQCEREGYRLITIFEDEWINKPVIVRDRLRHILGVCGNSIYARECTVREIDSVTSNTFIDTYHIQSKASDSIKLGLFDKFDGLVAVMTFAKPSLSKGKKGDSTGIWELSRFCSSVHVVGGASKLLSHFKKHCEWNEIYTYADRRWSDGNLYSKLGFQPDITSKPNYWYFNINLLGLVKKHRFNFRKNVLSQKLQSFDPSLTEWQNMINNGYDRIWDCGNLKYRMVRV